MSLRPLGWSVLRLSAAALLATYLALALPVDLRARVGVAALIVAPLYLAAHALRAVRLFLILYDGNLRLRDALFAHLHSAGVSALIPFKLGEIYRVAVLFAVSGRPARAVVAAWIERVFDSLLVVILLALLAVTAGPAALAGAAWFFPVVGVFLFASFFLFLVLPENLTLIKRHLILKHNNAAALRLLVLLDRLHLVLADASAIWRSRFATILWLSLGIWTLEGGAVIAVVGQLAGGADLAASSAHILTHITVRSSPWSDGDAGSANGMVLLAYRLGTVDVLASLALALALGWRFARTGARPLRRQALSWA